MDKSMSALVMALTGIAGTLLLSGCKAGAIGMNNKYDWMASECALEKYPMEILEGDFIFEDGRALYIPSGKTIHNGMGIGLSTHIVGPDLKPLPIKLAIHWFSYVEDKFYEGTFDLPAEKIKDLFREGMESPNYGKKITYRRIIVGLAPEGEVSVFLFGEGVILEIARFKAQEVKTEWKQLVDNEDLPRSEYIHLMVEDFLNDEQFKQQKQELVSGNNIWLTYKKQLSWKPEVTGPTPFRLWVKTFNGENEFFNLLKPMSDRTYRAIPKKLSTCWKSSSNKKYLAEVMLNEEHVLSTFAQLSERYPDASMTLLVKIIEKPRTPERSKILRTVELYLKASDEEVRLKTDELHVSKLRDDLYPEI